MCKQCMICGNYEDDVIYWYDMCKQWKQHYLLYIYVQNVNNGKYVKNVIYVCV